MAGFIKKRKTWYATLRLPSGKQKSISLKTRNKRVAKSRHKRIENLEYQMKSGQISEDEFLVKTGQKKDTSVVSLKETIDDFMEQYKLTKAVETLRNYHSTFSNLLNAWDEDKNIKTLTSSDYNTFLNFLINSEVKDSKTGRMKRRWNNT